MDWQAEIIELHDFFEDYFLGKTSSLARAETAFGPKFTFVGPNAETRNRASVIQMLADGHAHTQDLTITTTDHHLLLETPEAIVATYIEHHEHNEGQPNHRLTTVVFVPDPNAPNGLLWHRAQETWVAE
jgi:hypothetical protein